jgi:hypothetical protein
VVIGDQRSQSRLAGLVVVPNHGGEGQDALEDPDGDPDTGAATMAFQVQLALEGLVDRLDELPQRLEQPRPGPLGLALRAGRNSRRPSPASTRSNSPP